MDNIIRLSKIIKIIGDVTTVIFSLLALESIFTGNILFAVCIIPFIILGVILILAHKKQIIVINEDELVFSYLIKKTQYVKYKDFHCVLMIPLRDKTHVALIDKKFNVSVK